MARFYRCRQCGSLEGSVGTFSGEPEECDQCGHPEFEIVGPERVGFLTRVKGNLSTARAIRLMTGLGALAFIITVILPIVGVGQTLLVFGVANIVLLGIFAYGLIRHSAVTWGIATVVTGLATVAAVVLLVGMGSEMALGESLVPAVTEAVTTPQAILFLIFSLIYLAIFANLLGGREEFFVDREA